MARPLPKTLAISALIVSMLACNMPIPSSLGDTLPDILPMASDGSMTLEEAVDTAPEDSRDQVLSLMGAPDAFSLTWQPVGEHTARWEEWSYFDAGTRFDFVDGELVWTADLEPAPDGSLYAHQYDPTNFTADQGLGDLRDVLNVLGPQDLVSVPLDEADAPGGELIVGDQILLGFDGGRLVRVETLILAPDGSLSSTGRHVLAAEPPNAGLASAQPSGRWAPAAGKALGGDLSNVVPVVGFLVGWSHRNKIYRRAEAFISDRNAYYDKLRDTARAQLGSRQIGGLRKSQVAAYTKLVAMIEDQRQAELAVAEASKNEARQAFNKRVESIILQRVLGSGALQRVFSAMNRGLNSSQGFLDNAIQNLSGGAGGALGELQKVQRIARDVQRVAGAIGGHTGAGLQRLAGGLADAIGKPQAMVRDDIIKVKGDLAELQSGVSTLSQAGRTPSAGALATGIVLRPVAGDDPAVQAVTILISKLSVGDGSLESQAQAALDAGFVGRCAAIAQAYRAALDRLESGSGEAMSGESAAAPCRAIDPEELARRAAEVTPTGEAAGPPPPDVSQIQASIVVESAKYTKENCFVSSVNGWSFCDVEVEVKVHYETSEAPAVIHCLIGDDDVYDDVQKHSGDTKLSDVDEARNVSKVPLNFLAYCEILVGGQSVARTGVPGDEED